MQKWDGWTLFSAGDVVAFLECDHATTLALTSLATPLPRAEDDESLQLVQAKGLAHESDFLASLKAKGLRVAEIAGNGSPGALARETARAMREGHDVIFQAALLSGQFYGRADFLRRVEEPSALGRWRYEVLDTKLARSPKAKFVVQLAFYSDLLARAQGAEPKMMHLVLGDGVERSLRVANYSRYFAQVRERFVAFTSAHPNGTYPARCEHCTFCAWRDLCDARWTADDHLNLVAGITRHQVGLLQAGSVETLAALARLGTGGGVRKLQPETLSKLRGQAVLQLERRETGAPKAALLPLDPDRRRGLHRLPEPCAGDVFFDMEGDPFEPGGLEYLFGVRYSEGGEAQFQAFWAHDRAAERLAFEALMDFLAERLARHPRMHVYHYGHYEPTALKRLMSLHGTREAQVDDLLRRGKLVDLYKVVREALRSSEGYSLKDLEAFYMPPREGQVQTAGASIVQYERWRVTREAAVLEEIRRYNEDDCRSTHFLRDWIVAQRPAGLPWHWHQAAAEAGAGSRPVSARVLEIEAELERYRERLLQKVSADRAAWGTDEHVRELVFQLLDFHRRAAKPEWWAIFARMDMTGEELIDDVECLGALSAVAGHDPVPEARSLVHTFSYPEQETKLRTGNDCVRADNAERLGTIASIDEERRLVRLRINAKREVPDALSIGPGGPIKTEVLRCALLRFADAVASGDGRFRALRSILRKDPPVLRGHAAGAPVIAGTDEVIREAIGAAEALEDSYLFIQGPPGAGKTYAGSHLIAMLLQGGKRVGVSSNSHKAINNLLAAVELRASEQGFRFSGVKKSSADPESRFQGELIVNAASVDDVLAMNADLVAGTAWLFAEPEFEAKLDYLFVDEAGQVSLANLIAMGTCARNIVLLGDQMQLGQPIQGVHPGRSGESTLDYLLDGLATIPPERGIFLATTWRMHEDVCRFISDAVYDSRLHPQPANQTQALLLGSDAHPALRPTGIVFLPVGHDGCAQRSREEAEVVKALYQSLLTQRFRDKRGAKHRMRPENILVVAPYNSQVNLLKAFLPTGARVGTIDKFQGQEAEVVLASMTTSSGDYLPRNIEFLYDKNRLNVAISRAKCLAVVVASPALLHIKCSTPEQMELVNTLCWVKAYSSQSKGG